MKHSSVTEFYTKLATNTRKIVSINMPISLQINQYHISFSILLHLNFIQQTARESGQAIHFYNPFMTSQEDVSTSQADRRSCFSVS